MFQKKVKKKVVNKTLYFMPKLFVRSPYLNKSTFDLVYNRHTLNTSNQLLWQSWHTLRHRQYKKGNFYYERLFAYLLFYIKTLQLNCVQPFDFNITKHRQKTKHSVFLCTKISLSLSHVLLYAFFFKTSGPILSEVSVLCLLWLPSHRGNC